MKKLRFTRHAITRMAERQISTKDVRSVLSDGVVVKEYPNDTPYPGKLLLGFISSRPVHVVLSELEETTIIISVYEPDSESWESDFKRRKK